MNDDLLLQRLFDGTLSPTEQVEVNQRLRQDAALRDHLREVAEQAVAMRDFARGANTPREPVSPIRSAHQNANKNVRITHWLALAASIALLGASAWFWNGHREAPVLTLIDSSGSIAWSHGGDIRQSFAEGDQLGAGTFETIGETATAQLAFADGTLITLSGESELSYSDDGQKRLLLRKGSLSAQVKPQPKGRPMLIRTPSAEAEVLGTVFNLSARPDDTLLKVDEGLVKLHRLADGSSIDVPAKSSALASLAAGSDLDAASTPEPLTDWSFDFTTSTPPRDWRGFAKNGVMHASPYVAKKLPDGRIVTHHGISIRTAMLEQPLRLLVTESSVIRYRLRQQMPGDLLLMLLTNEANGNHGGNFECKIRAEELRPGPDGWCEIAIPLARYKPVDPRPHIRKRHPSATGNILTSAIINTYGEDLQLEVSRFELSPR